MVLSTELTMYLCSDKGLILKTSALVDKTKFSSNTPQAMQHCSFFSNLPPLFMYKAQRHRPKMVQNKLFHTGGKCSLNRFVLITRWINQVARKV